jgi:hypothetical protein
MHRPKEKTMKSLHAWLFVGVAFALPLSASAQSADAKYCAALADKYSGFLIANQSQLDSPQQVSARAGIDQCRAGNTAVGIPLLEANLRNVGLELPPRDVAPAPTYAKVVSHGKR